MLKIIVGAVSLVMATLPATAQSSAPGAAGMNAPTSPNSGAGIAGHPGNKNGPAAKSSSETTGAPANPSDKTQDASKIPGKPGGKSGPAERSHSGESPK